ncbi:MAG: fused MFS/spermidine synthase [Pirellulales bacterium]
MSQAQRLRCLVACYAVAIFAGAFLVFQVQPVIGRAILPWYGGSPAVWTTCMLFFQVVLLLGYLYAHVLSRLADARWQAVIHLSLIVAALAALPILPDASWKPRGGGDPTVPILALLAVHVGLPYFLLSATGPLMQAWFSRAVPGRSPYRLYALSNVGSLLALLTYPVVVEPALTVREQTVVWSLGFCFFALVGGYLAARLWRPEMSRGAGGSIDEHDASSAVHSGDESPTWGRRTSWLLLPAFASVMLLATTNHVCQDVAVIPFLWVAPLALYLLSFILCFDSERWYVRRRWAALAVAAVLAISLMRQFGATNHLMLEIGVYFAALLAVAMICHGELVRRKPAARYLTEFYLMCSAGGALGGVLVAVVCPLVFSTFAELHVGLILAYVLAAAVFWSDASAGKSLPATRMAVVCGVVLVVGLVAAARVQVASMRSGKLASMRSFYGVVHVDDVDEDDDGGDDGGGGRRGRVMFHGRVAHGFQFKSPERRRPTMYYDEQSGVGVALRRFPGAGGTSDNPGRQRPIRVGVIGLGVGVVAAYAEPGDTYRFYEINPDVETLARRYFTFLADCRGDVEVVLGDARRSMEEEPPQHYDVLVLDAFSGDAIPTHLLTREAFAVYRRHLAPGGAIAAHISNRHVDLAPVLANAAEAFAWQTIEVNAKTDPARAATASQWMLLTDNARFLADPIVQAAAGKLGQYADVRMWTDEYSNLLPLLK